MIQLTEFIACVFDRLAHTEDKMRLELHLRLCKRLPCLLLEGRNIRSGKPLKNLFIIGMIGVVNMPRIPMLDAIVFTLNQELLPHIVPPRLIASLADLVVLQTLLYAARIVRLLQKCIKACSCPFRKFWIGLLPCSNRFRSFVCRTLHERQRTLRLIQCSLRMCLFLRRCPAGTRRLVGAPSCLLVGLLQTVDLTEIHRRKLIRNPFQFCRTGFDVGQDGQFLRKICISMQRFIENPCDLVHPLRFLLERREMLPYLLQFPLTDRELTFNRASADVRNLVETARNLTRNETFIGHAGLCRSTLVRQHLLFVSRLHDCPKQVVDARLYERIFRL